MSTDATGAREETRRPRSTGGLAAEMEFDHERLVLRPTLRQVPQVTAEPGYRARTDDGKTLLFVSVRGDPTDAFEAALADDPTVANPTLVDRSPDRRVYRVRETDASISVDGWVAAVGGRIQSATWRATGLTVQVRLPDRDALIALNDRCRDRGLSVQVTRLRTAADDGTTVLGLTAKQQALLTVAYEEGYFEVPRGISQDELADRLGVSKSAISQRLRRAIGELCTASLST